MVVMESPARYRWVALGLAFVGNFSNGLAGQAVAPLAPLFQPELGLSKAEVGFFASAAYVGSWGVLLAGGSLTDRIGVRVVVALGQILGGIAMLSMATVGSFLQAVAVMVAVGLGKGVVAPGVTKAIVDWFPPTSRATVMGLKQTAVPAAGVVTGLTLPALALALGWRGAIAITGVLIFVGGIVTLVLYRDARPPGRRAGGTVGMRAGLGAMVRNRHIWTLGAIATLFSTTQLALLAHLPLYLKEVALVPLLPDEGSRVVAAGGYLALAQTGGVFARIMWGLVSDRLFHGRRLLVLSMVGALSAIMAPVVGYLGQGQPLWLWAIVALLCGASIVGWNGLYQALIAETAGRRLAATGVAFSMTMSEAGLVGGPPLFGFIVDLTGSYPTAWLFLGCLSALASLMAAASARQEKQLE